MLGALLLGAELAVARSFLPLDSTVNQVRDDSIPDAIKPMGLFDLNWGLNTRSARGRNDSVPGSKFSNQAFGLSGRIQSSILWSYKSIHNHKRFAHGDILAAEVFAGQLSSVLPHQTGSLWLAYKFEFGWGGRLRINSDTDLGLHLILLRFSRDNVSGNVSGSGVTGRFRYKRAMIEAGVEARRDVAFGVAVEAHKKIPLQATFTGRYLLKSGRNIGLNLEILSARYDQDSLNYSGIWSLKIFYGIYY